MISFPYLTRLLVLGMASFFLIHLVLGLLLRAMRHAVLGVAAQLRPRTATRFLLAVRLFPSAFGVLIVAGLCVPSYLSLEPVADAEDVGLWCLAAAVLGTAVWITSISRAVRSIIKSIQQEHYFKRAGIIKSLPGTDSPAVVIDGRDPVFALAGIVRPCLFVSRQVVSVLSDDQLSSAMRHEEAHKTSRDNLKRLLIVLAPDILPFVRGLQSIERGWAKFTEWAADDEAVEGNPQRSVSLATAIVQVARLGGSTQPMPFMASLLGADQDLAERVDRLLAIKTPAGAPRRGVLTLGASGIAVLFGAASWLVAQPATLSGVHRLLEQMLR